MQSFYFLSWKIFDFPANIAKICIRDWDKYGGRVLGELFLETGENVAEVLIH